MQVSPNKPLIVQVFEDGEFVPLPIEYQKKLQAVAREYIEEVKHINQRHHERQMKGNFLIENIRELIPDAPIPQKLISIGIREKFFRRFRIFLQSCQALTHHPNEWKDDQDLMSHPDFANLHRQSHELFSKIQKTLFSESSLPKSIRVRIYDSDHPNKVLRKLIKERKELDKGEIEAVTKYLTNVKISQATEELFKQLLAQAFLPSNTALAIIKAKKICPDMTEETEMAIKKAMTDAQRFDIFNKTINTCERIIEIKGSWIKHKKELNDHFVYLKKTILPMVLTLFREEKLVFGYIQEMIKQAEVKENGVTLWSW